MKELEMLQRSLSDGRLTRRDFLRRAAALGVMGAVPSFILQEEARASEPKRGGRFRLGATGGATSDVLAPGKLLDIMGINISFGQLRNCLTEISSSGELIGELAESWEASADAKVWTFQLRRDVEFHNGKTMNAQDVIFSLNEHRGDKSDSAAKGVMSSVTDIKADGNEIVIITLGAGNADFPTLLSDYHLAIIPNNTSSEEYEKGMGSGGYILADWEPGVRALSKRNPNYWKENSAFFDEVETLGIADTTARSNALRTGEIDAMNDVDLKTYKRLEAAGGIEILTTSGTKHMTMPMDTRAEPFNNNDVRLALKYAVNRQAMLDKILKGFGTLGNDHPIGLANTYHAGKIEQTSYDPEKAKFHLKKAGLTTLKIQLSAAETAFNGAVDAAVLFNDSASKAGITIDVVREPNDGYWSNVWMKKPFSMCYWGGRPTEDWMFSQVYAAEAEWNDTFWNHEKFNSILLQARSELDANKRSEMYTEMQLILNQKGGVIIPMFADYVMASSDKLAHKESIAANWELDGEKLAERWWFKG